MDNSALSTGLPPEIREAFISSAVTALQELVQIEAFPLRGTDATAVAAGDAVMAVVRLQRPAPGTMTLLLPLETARRISARYLPADTELTDSMVDDVAGELANVIAGQAKTILKGTPYHFRLSIPVVTRGLPGAATRGTTITLAMEAGQLVLLVDLDPCPGA